MKLYFAWGEPEELFDPTDHTREDLTILDLEISEQENEIPLARLRTLISPPLLSEILTKNYAFISCQKHEKGRPILLFFGRLLRAPQKIEGYTALLFFIAAPPNKEEQLTALHSKLKKDPFWDPLFVSPERREDPTEILEGHSVLYQWSRTHPEVQTTDLFEGRHSLDLKDHFFWDSLQIVLKQPPLSAVKIRLQAEWLQSYQGYRDLSFILKTHFKAGFINSFTGPDLLKNGGKPAKKLVLQDTGSRKVSSKK